MADVLTALSNLTDTPMLSILVRFSINFAAMLILVFGLYYRRYRDKELVTAASLFNVFVFSVLTILSVIEFSVAAGFGLFAILALFTLRSEPLSKVEMTYFFGSVAIAVICAVNGTSLSVVGGVVSLALCGAYILDHSTILQTVDRVRVTLDQIDPEALTDARLMRQILSNRLGVEVMSHQIRSIDYANELVRLDAFYRSGPRSGWTASDPVTQRSDPVTSRPIDIVRTK